MKGETGLITKGARSAPTDSAAALGEGNFDFVPGRLWRRMEISNKLIERGDILGSGS